MIDVTKPIETVGGFPVTILTTKRRGDSPVVVLVHHEDCDFLATFDPNSKDSGFVNVSPYKDWKIGDKIIVSSYRPIVKEDEETCRRYFAGIDAAGNATAFTGGATPWSYDGNAKPLAWVYAVKAASLECTNGSDETPYKHWKIGDRILVADHKPVDDREAASMYKRYFGGIDANGNAMAFNDGATEWSVRPEQRMRSWGYAINVEYLDNE